MFSALLRKRGKGKNNKKLSMSITLMQPIQTKSNPIDTCFYNKPSVNKSLFTANYFSLVTILKSTNSSYMRIVLFVGFLFFFFFFLGWGWGVWVVLFFLANPKSPNLSCHIKYFSFSCRSKRPNASCHSKLYHVVRGFFSEAFNG